MWQVIKPGGKIDAATPDEIRSLLQDIASHSESSRVRAPMVVQLDANGNGQDEVYTVPTGFEFEVRRVFFDLDTASDPTTGAVSLAAAGKSVEYLRAGSRMAYANPQGPAGVSIPGVETWGSEQGPYLLNGEAFEVKARGLTANARLTVIADGILHKRVPAR